MYKEHFTTLVNYVKKKFPRLSSHDAEDIVQDFFVKLQKRGTGILGDGSLESLKKHVYRTVLDQIRGLRAIKRGSDKITSLDQALESIGFEAPSDDSEARLELYLHMLDQLEFVNRILDHAIPLLPERELILLEIIRKWLPTDLCLTEIYELLSPENRHRFLPSRVEFASEDAEFLILRQVSRSKASLHQKLRKVRDMM